MSRKKMRFGKDRKLFKKTATRTKALNVGIGVVPRGGTRL